MSWLVYIDYFVILYFLGINSFYVLLLFLAVPRIFQRVKEVEIEEDNIFARSDLYPPISIIAPAYNEELTIEQSVRAMLALNYPDFEVVVVNDGSKDKTIEILNQAFELQAVPPAVPIAIKTQPIMGIYRSKLYPKLTVVDKKNGGKADSLNAGINCSRTPFFLAVDADTLIEKDALIRMATPLLINKNVIACGGTISVVNNCDVVDGEISQVRFPTNFLAGIQVVEYMRAYLFGRMGWNRLGGNLVISGAFGLFEKKAVIDVGGYLTGTVGEDIELTVKLHRYMRKQKRPYEVVFIPDPVAWTEVPTTWSVLSRQRERWHRGLIDTLWRHKQMFLNPRYGLVGMVAFPFFVFGELLAPVVEVFGLLSFALSIGLGIVNWEFFMRFLVVSLGLSTILTVVSIVLSQASLQKYHKRTDFFKMILYSIAENFGYRQMSVWWRFQSFYKYMRGYEGWGNMVRKGFNAKSNKPAAKAINNVKPESDKVA